MKTKLIKLIILSMLGLTLITSVGCNSTDVKTTIDNKIPTVTDSKNTEKIDDLIYKYMEEDTDLMRNSYRYSSKEELEGNIKVINKHFSNRLEFKFVNELYKDNKGLTSNQKEFLKEYYDFCDSMKDFSIKSPKTLEDNNKIKKVLIDKNSELLDIYIENGFNKQY